MDYEQGLKTDPMSTPIYDQVAKELDFAPHQRPPIKTLEAMLRAAKAKQPKVPAQRKKGSGGKEK